ncbi:hypothetical protein RI065_11675 [Mycoplasmatota bacterium zrk1]
MKRMIFGTILISGGFVGIIAVICSSIISQQQHVRVLMTSVATVYDFFIILTAIGVIIFFYEEIKEFYKKLFVVK